MAVSYTHLDVYKRQTHTNAMNRLKSAENRLNAEELEAKWQNSFSHKLGIWSLEHTPKGWPK